MVNETLKNYVEVLQTMYIELKEHGHKKIDIDMIIQDLEKYNLYCEK